MTLRKDEREKVHMPTGIRNSIADVTGLTVGNAHDERLASGVTAVMCEAATVAAASVFGGGPGTRERTPSRLKARWARWMPSCFPAARRSASMRQAACKASCANGAAAFPSAPSPFPSCRKPSCSISSTAATRLGPPLALSRYGLSGCGFGRERTSRLGSAGAGLGATVAAGRALESAAGSEAPRNR